MITLFFVATAGRAYIQMLVTILKGCKKLLLGHAEQEARVYSHSTSTYLPEKLALRSKDPNVVHHL